MHAVAHIKITDNNHIEKQALEEHLKNVSEITAFFASKINLKKNRRINRFVT